MKLLEVYSCGCYQDGQCMLTKKDADCIYYDMCMHGFKPPSLVEEIGNEEKISYITDLI